jgi:quinoprotein glucose dehydrogenase
MESALDAALGLTGSFHQIAVVNTSHILQYIQLYDCQTYERVASGSGNAAGYCAQAGAPFGISLKVAMNWLGMPCWAPPFGELVAIDMHAGDVKWRKPLGSSQKYGFYMPEPLELCPFRTFPPLGG